MEINEVGLLATSIADGKNQGVIYGPAHGTVAQAACAFKVKPMLTVAHHPFD